MELTSAGIVNGKFLDKYGKRARGGHCSPPLHIENAPENTASFALFCEDRDAAPVCGFSWIHWVAANIKTNEIPENAGKSGFDFVQGVNSCVKSDGRAKSACFGAFAPPDAPHQYDIYVYALDKTLPLTPGFYMNELFHAMEGHILATAKISGIYDD